jgi:pimeloyl-ACP methyl ester carboxylesterase
MLLSFPTQTQVINGLTIRYAVIGQGEPLLCIHGFGAMLEYWYKNIDYFAQAYQVIVLDLPGFGYSDPPKLSAGIDYYADFIKQFLVALNISAVHLVGHSLGGAIALRFAERHAAAVKTLILLSSAGFATQLDWSFRLLTVPILGKMLLQANREQFAAALRAHVYHQNCLSDEFIDVVYTAQRNPLTQKTFLTLLQRDANIFGIKARVIAPIAKDIKLLKKSKMLILWGKQDRVLAYNVHTAAAKALLHSVPLVSIDACGHLPQLEQSVFVNKTVWEFLQNVNL